MRLLTTCSVAAVFALSATLVPLITTAQSSADYSTQVQQLTSQISVLQQILAAFKGGQGTGQGMVSAGGTIAPTNSACPNIGRTLKLGMSGDDVQRLQQFLARDVSVYPEGQATGYFGALTEAAVQRWQSKNNIVSSGSPDTTGFGMVGPRTAAAIALQCSSSSSSTGSQGTSVSNGDVGGFIQVNPVTGDAPLTVSVIATVNTVNSCQNALYILDWGDSARAQTIPVSANVCNQVQQTYTHTYQYGGKYTITLTANGHQSSAVVLVNGPLAPTDGTNSSVSVTSPTGGQNLQTGDTMTIAWKTNGTIPSGSSYVVDLYTGSGQKVASNDVIAISTYAAGSLQWKIPTVPQDGAACALMYPSGLCGVVLPTGSYKIHLKVYKPSTSGNTFGALITEADSGTFTIISTGGANVFNGYQPLVVLPAQNDPFTASATFNIAACGSSEDPYQIAWGDGSVDDGSGDIRTQNACPSGNSTVSTTITKTHTYTSAGSYTVDLQRGPSLSQEDRINYTVQD